MVTNVDREHLDHYPTLDAIRAAFIEFVNKVPFYGAVIVCLDDANVQGLLPEIRRRTITYGTTAQADVEATEIVCGPFVSEFDMRYRTADLGRFTLRIPGRHNVLNAMAAIAVAMELEVKPDAIREGAGHLQRRGSALPDARQSSAASRWWTITDTTPRKFALLSMAPACAGSGAFTCCSSRTAIHARFI